MRTIARALAVLVVLAGGPLAASTLGASASVTVTAVAGPWVGVEFADDGTLIGQSSTVDVEVTRTMVGDTLVTRIIAVGG